MARPSKRAKQKEMEKIFNFYTDEQILAMRTTADEVMNEMHPHHRTMLGNMDVIRHMLYQAYKRGKGDAAPRRGVRMFPSVPHKDQ